MLNFLLCFIALVIVLCVILNNASQKIGMPMLLAFIVLGIVLGNFGPHPVKFEDYSFAESFSTVALIFIMFYGGFGTRWKTARSAALPAGILASAGVVVTAMLTGLFCHFVFRWDWIESMLMGAVISSTDAASVFSILRSHKLGLKNNLSPMLEIESGSNDPFSYMLTVIMISLLNGSGSGAGSVAWMFFAQIAFGAGFGFLIGKVGIYAMKHIRFSTSGFDSLFIFATALFAYGLPSLIGGNGYLSTYLVGLMLGNSELKGKKSLVNFFDGLTGLMQVLIFFMLGLLARPEQMGKVIAASALIFLFLLLVARPLAVCPVLTAFRRYPFRQQLFVSFVGLRGASSIVFAIFATISDGTIQNDILNIVFCIVLLSISLQGYLLPFVARKLDIIDKDNDVMTTFTDFSEETDLSFSQIAILEGDSWDARKVSALSLPRHILICKLVHPDGSDEVPDGNTVLHSGDTAIICTQACTGEHTINISERDIEEGSRLCGQTIREYSPDEGQILLIRRNGTNIIPGGDTVLQAGDHIYYNKK